MKFYLFHILFSFSANLICPVGPITSNSNQVQVDGPIVEGYGTSALLTFTSGGRALGTFVAGTSPVTLIGFNLGINVVQVEVNDGLGNSDTCQFTVIVERKSMKNVTYPPNIVSIT